MSKQEELAWEVYKTKFTNLGEGSHAFVMYKLCFLAGYRAAQQSVQPTPESGRVLPVESNDSVGSAPAISG
jgi:hypothetical protein